MGTELSGIVNTAWLETESRWVTAYSMLRRSKVGCPAADKGESSKHSEPRAQEARLLSVLLGFRNPQAGCGRTGNSLMRRLSLSHTSGCWNQD